MEREGKSKIDLGTFLSLELTALLLVGSFSAVRPMSTHGYHQRIHALSQKTLPPGHYLYCSYRLIKNQGKLHVTVNVTCGPPIDLFFMEEGAFHAYSADDSFTYYKNVSDLNTTYTKSVLTAPKNGTFYFVVDNTDKGLATPQGRNVTFKLTHYAEVPGRLNGTLNDTTFTTGEHINWKLWGTVGLLGTLAVGLGIFLYKNRRKSTSSDGPCLVRKCENEKLRNWLSAIG